MAFNKNDIYTSSGSVRLYNSWTPYVSKFDTSAFYNWEQDNLPLYDLEERTYELWEYNGFPTSGLTGIALTVSANAPALTLAQNRNIYTTVSAAIAAIPRVVRYPVLIEVANYGSLGPIELHDFQIMENGSIEIINRNYATVYDNNVSFGTSATITQVVSYLGKDYITRIGSADLSSTLGIGVSSTSAVDIATPVFSSVVDPRFTAVNSVLYPDISLKKGPLCVGVNNSNTINLSTANRFEFSPYENSYTALDQMYGLDHSSINQFTTSVIKRTAVASGTDEALGAVYGNSVSKISVRNCSGKIYIRNFFVDGNNRSYAGTPNGIEVNNSQVVLENCASVGCSENGFLFNNSKVTLSRLAFAYRNYNQTGLAARSSSESCGFKAVNSEVTLSSLVGGSTTQARDHQTSGSNVLFCASRNKIGFLLENSVLTGGLSRLVTTNQRNRGALVSELNEVLGIKAVNSQIKLRGLIDVYENKDGIELFNSVLFAEEFSCDRHTNAGLTAKNSLVLINDSLINLLATIDSDTRAQVDFNLNGQHLNLENSIFTFKKTTGMPEIYGGMKFVDNHGVEFASPAKHTSPAIKVLNNSELELIHSQHTIDGTYYENNTPCYGKLISADNNSNITLYGTKNHCTVVLGPTTFAKQKYLAALCAKNGSTINIHGPSIIGQAGVDILAESNSVINMTPPMNKNSGHIDASGFQLSDSGNHTSIELHSTRACLVADKNSTINMEDLGSFKQFWTGTKGAQVITAGEYDYPEYDNIETFIASGSVQFYPNPHDATVVDNNNTDEIGMAITTSPSFTYDATAKRNIFVSGTPSYGGVCVRALGNSTVNAHNVHFGEGSNTGPLDGVIYNASGATCDHLMIWNIADESKLKASLLSISGTYGADSAYHGPASVYVSSDSYGTNSLTTRVAYGAPSATPDTGTLSILDSFGAGGSSVSASWKTVSGVGINDPFNRFYPISGGVIIPQLASSLAHANLPVSGRTVTGIQYGTSAANTYSNYGLFRIYFSPDPVTKYLQHDVSGYAYGATWWNSNPGQFTPASGMAYQIFAQGYNMSSPVSAINLYNDVSAYHPNLMKLSKDSNNDGVPDMIHPSGFYYCIEFLKDNPSQVIIDESAANVFQNAKNASLGTSGRPKRVSIYKAGSTPVTGESNPGSFVGYISTNTFDLKRDN